MGRLIDADALIAKCGNWYVEEGTEEGFIGDLKHLLDSQPSASQWIPCSERLPEYEEEVLVTRHFLSDNQLKKNAITESLYVEVASRMDDEWTSYSDDYKIKSHLHKVIAWMPLPDPYGGKQE